ncbi:MAG TPA: EpsI family protein [Vicinamibacterales bacterium]|nr:EpsI family protein [Vicinamibacterales bacterium]
MSTRARAFIALVLVLATAALARVAHTSTQPPDPKLDRLPQTIGAWTGREADALDEESARILGADAYLTRNYRASGTAAPVGLYVAYYSEQRPGVSIHSPLHCLPGNGWEPIEVSRLDIPAAAGADPLQLRRMIVRKRLDRSVVLYWYSVHGRMLAGELTSKLWLLHDSVRLHRSDAALVRIVVPAGRDAASVDAAERQGIAFARDLLPLLANLWS